jgi:6-phosphogluconolactonase (cycloisomerase 2 family)
MGNKGSQWMTLALVTSLAGASCSFTSRCSASDVFCNPGLALFLYTKLPRFAYTANYSAHTISMYRVDQATGSLSANGTVSITNPFTVVADPLGRYLYATSETTSSGQIFLINQITGTLEPAGTFSAGANPTGIYHRGAFAYVVNTGGATVSTYRADRATGALSSVGSVAAASNPYRMAFAPSGRFAYVAQSGSNNIAQYTVDADTGLLTAVGPVASGGNNPFDVTAHPSGSFVYTANNGTAMFQLSL